jgi:hypothetical protein
VWHRVSCAASASQILNLVPTTLTWWRSNVTCRPSRVGVWLDHADWTLSTGTTTVDTTSPGPRLAPSWLGILVHACGIGI